MRAAQSAPICLIKFTVTSKHAVLAKHVAVGTQKFYNLGKKSAPYEVLKRLDLRYENGSPAIIGLESLLLSKYPEMSVLYLHIYEKWVSQ